MKPLNFANKTVKLFEAIEKEVDARQEVENNLAECQKELPRWEKHISITEHLWDIQWEMESSYNAANRLIELLKK